MNVEAGRGLIWVIVCFGNHDDAKQLVESLGGPSAADFVVVDNAPHAPSAVVLTDGTALPVVRFPDNPGYLGALARVARDFTDERHIVLSNADMRGSVDTVRSIETTLQDDEITMLAPTVLTPDGSNQNPYYRTRPTRSQLARAAWSLKHPWLSQAIRLLRPQRRATELSASVDSAVWGAHGSVLIFSKQYRNRGGRFEYPCRLFSEEIWCGAEVERVDGKVLYAPSIVLSHREHATTGREWRRRGALAEWQKQSCQYWLDVATREAW